jgi:hypothetical protein
LNWKFLTFLEIEAMNKFEALAQFQGWPPEWQRLCAEYWAETDEGSDMRLAADRETLRKVETAWTTADKIQTVGELVQRGAALPTNQPKAAKVAAVPRRKHHSKQAWSAAESEYLLKLASEDQPLWNVVAFFLSRHPGRSRDAVRRRVWGIRSGKPESEVKY